MRTTTLVLLVALGCAGPRSHPVASGPPAVARDYTATRWIPARPTYAVAARKVRDAQRALIDVVDSIGIVADVDASEVSAGLRALLAVDPLSPDAVTAMGVDLEGGIAIFSESIDPTVVVHLSAPEQTQAFFDQQRQQGLATQSQIVDGVELFTAKLAAGVEVGWAIDHDWMWVHFELPAQRRGASSGDGTAWLAASRHPGPPAWAADWQYAQATGGAPTVVGFVDPRALVASLSRRVPDAIACARLVEPVGRLGFAVEGDGRHAAMRVALDVGPAGAGVAHAILPPPAGWAAVAAQAPLAAQWNLDLEAVRGWLAPCARTFDLDLGRFDAFGVRAARILLQSFDPDDKDGTGAVALDITRKGVFGNYLDEIPLRSRLESTKQYGPHTGHRLAIPFGPTIEYVLTDSIALLGVGDGMLARVVGNGPGRAASGPIFALDLVPGGLSPSAWEFLLRAAQIPQAKRVAEHLHFWHDAHLVIRIDGTRIVLEAGGSRS